MSTIPASTVVSVLPGVLAAGGSSLALNGLMLTNSTRLPIGSVQSFGSADEVSDFFGQTSLEASFAATYFAGFDNSTVKPGAMLATQFNPVDVSAYLRGGNLAATTTLAQLTGFSGTLSVTIDGSLKTASINLSGATSFTNAAQLIEAGLGISGGQLGTVTATIAATVMTVSAVLTGGAPIAVGTKITGSSVTADTFVTSFGTGTGGAGTYNLSASSTEATPETMAVLAPAVSFDSVSGAFVINSATTGASSTITYGSGALATDLLLTQATGAVLSQGAVAATPTAFMTAIVQNVRNWASFFLTFNPDNSGIANRLAFSQWASQQNNRYVYVATDSDTTPATENPASASLGAQIKALGYSATSVNWQPSETFIAAFVSGAIASINFDAPGGRITFNGKSQSGLTPGVTDETTKDNLIGNGYNYYAALGTANADFIWYENGSVSGPFTWLDSLVNSIWLTNAFQLTLMTLLQNTNSIPYNSAGNAQIEQALSDDIQQGLSFGAYSSGVTVSGSQAAAVNAAAGGLNIAPTLTVQGWYLFIGTASPTVRQQRGSPPITFFYTDGEAVQKITLSSVVLL